MPDNQALIKNIISLDKFIYSLGIRHIGQENAKLMAQHLKTVDNFYKLSENKNFDSILNIDGIGETQIKSLDIFFENLLILIYPIEFSSICLYPILLTSILARFKLKDFILSKPGLLICKTTVVPSFPLINLEASFVVFPIASVSSI